MRVCVWDLVTGNLCCSQSKLDRFTMRWQCVDVRSTKGTVGKVKYVLGVKFSIDIEFDILCDLLLLTNVFVCLFLEHLCHCFPAYEICNEISIAGNLTCQTFMVDRYYNHNKEVFN